MTGNRHAGVVIGVGLADYSLDRRPAECRDAERIVESLSLGVRIHRLRWVALMVASLMTASAVAISGPIGFVGLVCPHLARLFVGNDQRKLLPLATALGAGLLAVADAASRKLAARGGIDTLLPVGVITGLLGGPFFLILLWRSRRRGASA